MPSSCCNRRKVTGCAPAASCFCRIKATNMTAAILRLSGQADAGGFERANHHAKPSSPIRSVSGIYCFLKYSLILVFLTSRPQHHSSTRQHRLTLESGLPEKPGRIAPANRPGFSGATVLQGFRRNLLCVVAAIVPLYTGARGQLAKPDS